MHLHYRLTFEDNLEFRRSIETTLARVGRYINATVCCLAGTVLVYWLFHLPVGNFYWLIGLGAGASLPLSQILERFGVRRRLAKVPAYRYDTQAELTEEGLFLNLGDGCESRTWSELSSITETPRLFVLRLDQYHAYLVPKRAFACDQEAKFRQLVESKIPQNPHRYCLGSTLLCSLPQESLFDVSFIYTKQDLREFTLRAIEKNEKGLLWSCVALWAPLLGLRIFLPTMWSEVWPYFMAVALLPLVVLGFGRLAYFVGSAKRRDLPQERHLTVNPTGLQINLPGHRQSIGWSLIQFWQETPGLLLLNLGHAHDAFYPKRVFTALQMECFRELLTRHVGPRKS